MIVDKIKLMDIADNIHFVRSQLNDPTLTKEAIEDHLKTAYDILEAFFPEFDMTKGVVCNESFTGDPVTVGSDECRSCVIQLEGAGETCRKRLRDIEPDTSSEEEDRRMGTKGTTVGKVEAGLSRVEESKENIREFFRHSPMNPQDLELIDPIIETFGWIYPTDCVNACVDVLRADNRIPLELVDRLRENWNALKFSGGEPR